MPHQDSASTAPPAGTGTETVLYHAADVWITDTRVVIGDRTYRLNDIASPAVVSLPPAQRFRTRLVVVPPALVCFAFLLFANYDNTSFGPLFWAFSVAGFVALVSTAVFAFLRLRRTRIATLHSLRLTGKSYTYTSTNGEYTRWLARQIMRAKEGGRTLEGPFDSSSFEGGPNEYVYYWDGRAAVTSKRVVLDGNTFQLPDIKKATVAQVQPEAYTRRFSLGITFLIVAIILNNFKINAPNYGRDFYLLFPEDTSILSLLLIMGTFVMMFSSASRLAGSAHIVRLHGNFGEVDWVEVFASFNEAYAKVLANQINSAISTHKAGIYAGNSAMPT
ncbi:MAG: DUF6232 family protein [Chloroflexota bacterium]|nr:DUF6232 family protein [Chloroflexota bacterium]